MGRRGGSITERNNFSSLGRKVSMTRFLSYLNYLEIIINNLQNLPHKLFKLEKEMNKGMKNSFIYLFKKRKIGSIAYQAGNFFFHACWTKNFLQSLPFPYTPLEKRINLFTCRACSSIRKKSRVRLSRRGRKEV